MSHLRRQLVTAAFALVAAACGPAPTTSVVPPTIGPTTAPTFTSTPIPSASPIALLRDEDLAPVSLEDERPTSICDTEPRTNDIASPQSQIACYDGLQTGLRALRTKLPSIDKLYLRYGPCAASPCTQAEVDTVEVIGWSGQSASSVMITLDPYTITAPTEAASAAWPSPSSTDPPPIAKTSIDGAANEMRQRTPYPFCGRTTRNPFLGTPQERPGDSDRVWAINRCFFDGILDGRPVEMIEIAAVTRQPILLRFDGRGFVTRYISMGVDREGSLKWYRNDGPIILNASVFFGLAFNDNAARVR